jgi:F-type H+-transporting ATPase subunit gamma
MAKLKPIRDRIKAVKNTRKITEAMRLVAAARVRRAQEQVMATRPLPIAWPRFSIGCRRGCGWKMSSCPC